MLPCAANELCATIKDMRPIRFAASPQDILINRPVQAVRADHDVRAIANCDEKRSAECYIAGVDHILSCRMPPRLSIIRIHNRAVSMLWNRNIDSIPKHWRCIVPAEYSAPVLQVRRNVNCPRVQVGHKKLTVNERYIGNRTNLRFRRPRCSVAAGGNITRIGECVEGLVRIDHETPCRRYRQRSCSPCFPVGRVSRRI